MFETPEKSMTLDEFLTFIEPLEDSIFTYELYQGMLVKNFPAKARPAAIAALLCMYIYSHIELKPDGIGSVHGGFKYPPEDFYVPDVAYYPQFSLAELDEDDYFPIAPDLAVEVVSGNGFQERAKAVRYVELGVRLVWVVYPKRRAVEVYTPTSDGFVAHVLNYNDTLDGGDVLPGFTLPVKKVFGL